MPPKEPPFVGVPYSVPESGTPTFDALAHLDTGGTASRPVCERAETASLPESMTQAPAQLLMLGVHEAIPEDEELISGPRFLPRADDAAVQGLF